MFITVFINYNELNIHPLIIISIVFLQGGIFKKMMVYEQFLAFISLMRSYLDNAIEYINKKDKESFTFFMAKLELFKKCYLKNKRFRSHKI